MAGLLNAKQLVDGSVTPNKLSERYLQVNEQGEVYGDLIVNGNTTLSETATYKGSEIATKGDLYDEGGINDLINDLDEKKQNNLIAGENIQIAPDRVTISSSTKVADSDRVLTYDAAGLKANITLVVDGNQIRVEGKTDESGIPYILGEFNVLQSQIIDDVYVENGHLFITFIVDGNPGKEKVDIDLSEFIDIYEGSDYIDINGQEVSLKYSEVRDKLINDGMASTTDLPDLSPYVQKSTTVWGKPLTSNITGDISSTGNITPATSNTYNIGTTAVRYKDIYANSAGFTGTVTATGGFAGNATTATTLQTPRTIQLTGVVTGSASFDGGANATITTSSNTLATKAEIPTSLPNPNAITFTGAATGTYNGSAALTVNIPGAPDLSGYVTTTSLNNTLANYATKTELTNGLAGKADMNHSHTEYAYSAHTHPIYDYAYCITDTGLTPSSIPLTIVRQIQAAIANRKIIYIGLPKETIPCYARDLESTVIIVLNWGSTPMVWTISTTSGAVNISSY